MSIFKKKVRTCSLCFQEIKPFKRTKLPGKYRLVTELGDLLVKKRIIIDDEWKKFMRNVIEGKYAKRQYIFDK